MPQLFKLHTNCRFTFKLVWLPIYINIIFEGLNLIGICNEKQ